MDFTVLPHTVFTGHASRAGWVVDDYRDTAFGYAAATPRGNLGRPDTC